MNGVNRTMNPAVLGERGQLTISEILSQPQCWATCVEKIVNDSQFGEALRMGKPDADWIFVGCGSSYYLALAAAATFNSLRLPAFAVPASEVLMYPDLTLRRERRFIPVMISRSGRTSEVVRCAHLLEKRFDLRTIAITCADQQPLEQACSVTLKLLDADERSTIMTRSFTSMLMTLQYLGATISGDDVFRNAMLDLPGQLEPVIDDLAPRLRSFAESRRFEDFVFLAQGPLFGIASECMLKVMEASCSYAQVFHALEFRHGPKSIAGAEVLITFLISETSYDAEVELLEEMKCLGATTMVIANRLDDRARRASDFAVELKLNGPEAARSIAFAVWGQLFGAYYGLKKGLNPDSPTNLTRVVELAD